jgi:hypothetical protein
MSVVRLVRLMEFNMVFILRTSKEKGFYFLHESKKSAVMCDAKHKHNPFQTN